MQPDVDSNDTLLLKDASPKSPSRVPPLRSMKRTPVADGRCRVPSPPLTPRLVASTTACHLGALYLILEWATPVVSPSPVSGVITAEGTAIEDVDGRRAAGDGRAG